VEEDGKQVGVMTTQVAVRIAQEKGMDLVEINPKGNPPVCKLIDYGRFKYEEKKQKNANKKKQNIVQVKEIKLRPKTDSHDLHVKVRSVIKFLSEGNKAKLVIQFRGREIVHPETGKSMLQKVLVNLGDLAVVEQMPVMEGRRMSMMVAPKPGAVFPTDISKTMSDTTKADSAEATTEKASAGDSAPDTPPGPV